MLEALRRTSKSSYEVRQGGPGSKPRLFFISRLLCALPLPRLMVFFFVPRAGLLTRLSACRPSWLRPSTCRALSGVCENVRATLLVHGRAASSSSICTVGSCTGMLYAVWACMEAC